MAGAVILYCGLAFGAGVGAGALCTLWPIMRWVLGIGALIGLTTLTVVLQADAGDWFLLVALLGVGALIVLSIAFWPGFALGRWLVNGSFEGPTGGRGRSFAEFVPAEKHRRAKRTERYYRAVPIVPREE
ncbi:MAG: hypothetical protein AAGI10_05830 [Pseudomonadota bacterium]